MLGTGNAVVNNVPMIPYPYILAVGEDRYQLGTNGGNNKEVILCKWN